MLKDLECDIGFELERQNTYVKSLEKCSLWTDSDRRVLLRYTEGHGGHGSEGWRSSCGLVPLFAFKGGTE